MITREDITLIDHFINEKLNPEELQRFQLRVRDDFEFSHEVREHIAAVRSTRSYCSLQFMDELKSAYPEWKAEGFQKYSPSIDVTKIILRIAIPGIILGLSYGIYYVVRGDRPTPKPATEEVVAPSTNEVSPTDTATFPDSSSGNQP